MHTMLLKQSNFYGSSKAFDRSCSLPQSYSVGSRMGAFCDGRQSWDCPGKRAFGLEFEEVTTQFSYENTNVTIGAAFIQGLFKSSGSRKFINFLKQNCDAFALVSLERTLARFIVNSPNGQRDFRHLFRGAFLKLLVRNRGTNNKTQAVASALLDLEGVEPRQLILSALAVVFSSCLNQLLQQKHTSAFASVVYPPPPKPLDLRPTSKPNAPSLAA
jgi:hypothetical protein